MQRYLTPAPAQLNLGQQSQVAAARFGPILAVNTVGNADGSMSLAVYVDQPAALATVTAWKADVVATPYVPDPTLANEGTVRQQLQAALAANRTFLAIPSPTQTQVRDQAQALTRQLNGVIRMLLNQFDGTN